MTDGADHAFVLDASDATIAKLFIERCRRHPDTVAYAYKDLGLWHEVTYRQLADQVGAAVAALRDAGLRRGDRIALMGDFQPPFLVIDLAAQLLGAISYGLYPTTQVEDVSYLVRHGGARIFTAENQEYVDKVLEVDEPLPDLQRVLVLDPRGMFDYDSYGVMFWEEFLAEAPEPLDIDDLDELASAIDPDEAQFIFYTSGTTGRPKGAMLSHRNILYAWSSFFSVVPAPTPRDRLVIDLPLAHIGGRMFAIFLPVMYGCVPHFPESVEDVGVAKTEVSPTMAFGTPRLWEKHASQISVGIDTSSWLKRTVFSAAIAFRRWSVGRRRSAPLSYVTWAVDRFWRYLAIRPVLEELGYDDLRFCVVGGAAIPEEVSHYWKLMGIEFNELYGATETSGVATVQEQGMLEPGMLGKALPGSEFRISPDGEILLRGPNVFKGYWNDPDATLATVDGEWLSTGDAGELLEDGSLRVLDRQKNLIITESGERVHPAEIENGLKASAFVSDAILLGHERPFLAALIEIDFEAVSEWARNHGVVYTSFTNLTSQPEVVGLIRTEADRVNERLAAKGVPQVREVRILPKELDPETGEVTPTRKIKRSYVEDQFSGLLEEIYRQQQPPLDSEAVAQRTESV